MLGRNRKTGFVAIDLSSGRIEVARVAQNGARPKVEFCSSFEKQGNDIASLTELRKEFSLEQYRCSTLLAPGDYRLQLLDAPNVPAEEVKAAARWRLKDFLDYPIEEATIDVFPVPSDPNAPTRAKSVYAVAARNDRIAATMDVFAQAKLPLAVIDIPEMAQRNVAQLFEVERRAIGLLSFGEERGLLTFSAGGELYVARPIETGLADLRTAAGDLQTKLFERLVLEVQRSLDHFDRQFSFIPVAKLLLAPLPEEIGLESYLKQNLYVPVEVAWLDSVLDFDAAPVLVTAQRQQSSFLALGAALRREATR
jgi:MSHA biogenesis protein MshI